MIEILILVNLIVYFRTLSYDMVIDDNCRRFHIKDLPKNWFKRLYRNTHYSGYGGLSLPIDHLFNIVLHTLCCITIYSCLGKNDLSFITALLFSIHPVNNQVSIWLNGKRYSIVAMLILLSWAFKPQGIIFYLISPLWHFGGVPAVLLYLFSPHRWVLWLLLVPLIISYKTVLDKVGTRWERIPWGEVKIFKPRKFVILFKMFGYVFLHCLLPRRMSFYHMFMERFGFSDKDNKYWYSLNKDFWIGLPVTIGVVTLMIMNWNNPIGFGLFWWIIFMLPWLQFPISLTQAISERTYYLPLIGLCYALSYVLRGYPYITIILFTYYLVKLWFYMPAYKNLEEFYRYALHEFPDHFRARGHIIQKELNEKRVFWALKDAGVGLGYTPHDCTLNMLMAKSLMALGAWHPALEYLKKAEENLVIGHEKHLTRIINNFRDIIKHHMAGTKKPGRIQPGDVVEIKPSQFAGGK